jgi:galactokinase/galacturonokinase
MIPIDSPEDSRERVARLKRRHKTVFGSRADRGYFVVTVPLRICPLGAHSDHQGGTVTGVTINRSITLLARARDDSSVRVFSENFDEERHFDLTDIPSKVSGDWANYARGVAYAIRQAHPFARRGFEAVIHGAMPVGGLSSSAAVTIAYARALEHVNSISHSALETILLVRATENGYLGLHNGILDQSVIVSSKKDHLTTIQCLSHSIETVASAEDHQPYEILVVYSGLSRQLTSTPFNQRVAECKEAAKLLLERSGRSASESPILAEAGVEAFMEYGDRLPAHLCRRARHFFTEADRVKRGIDAWKRGRMDEFGALVTASGESSIVNYESGSPALISLYENLAGISGVYGTRFCGGGFQGCCLALIDPSKRESIAEALHEAYTKKHPELAGHYSLHICHSSDSVSLEVFP